jgi:hypothetical protein
MRVQREMVKFKKEIIQGISGTNKSRYVKYELELRGNVTIIDGDSATGKTLMCQMSKQMIAKGKKSLIVYDTTNMSAVSIDVLKTYKNKLIIFDDADVTVQGKLLEFILNDKRNYYILFRRNNYDVKLSPNYYAEIVKCKDKVRRLKYHFEKVGWFD